jgi:hypothetical protein
MPSFVRRLLAAALLAPFILVAPAALGGYREDMRVTSVEIARLPQFCWRQFEVPDTQTDEFRIRDCGPAANHYCPALIYLIRAKRSTGRGKQLLIEHAHVDVRYTEDAIANYPRCSIREHVDATRAEINTLLRVYGGKPASAK